MIKIHADFKFIILFFNDVGMRDLYFSSCYFCFLSRVRFALSHVTREPLAPIVIQPVVAITRQPVTPRLACVFVQLGTSAKSRSLGTVLY